MSTSLYECSNRPGTTRDKRAAEGMCEECEALLTGPYEMCQDCCAEIGHGEGDTLGDCSWCGDAGTSERRASFAAMAMYDSSKGD